MHFIRMHAEYMNEIITYLKIIPNFNCFRVKTGVRTVNLLNFVWSVLTIENMTTTKIDSV